MGHYKCRIESKYISKLLGVAKEELICNYLERYHSLIIEQIHK